MSKILAIAMLAFCFSIVPVFAQNSASVRETQQALKDKGFDPGPVDGVYGPHTRQALRQYQRQQHLTVSGRLNNETMDSLGVSHGTAGSEMNAAGKTIEHSYAKGGKEVGHGAKEMGHDIKHGDVVEGAKDLGKGVGHGVKDMGVGTGHATKDAAKGVKDGVTGDKSTKQ